MQLISPPAINTKKAISISQNTVSILMAGGALLTIGALAILAGRHGEVALRVLPFFLSLIFAASLNSKSSIQACMSILIAYYILAFYIAIFSPKISDVSPSEIRTALALTKNLSICGTLCVYVFFNRRKINVLSIESTFGICILLSALIPVDYTSVKFQYLANSYIPLYLSVIAIATFLKSPPTRSNNLNYQAWINPILITAPAGFIISYLLIPSDFFVTHQEAKGYELISGLPRNWWSSVGDSLYLRFSGTSEDPILFGYLCAALATILSAQKRYIGLFLLAALTISSLSKGAIIWMLGSILIPLAIKRFKWKAPAYTLITLALIYLYINGSSDLKTSANVHLIGLATPFIQAINTPNISSLIGHGVGSSGNILKSALLGDISNDDWLSGGAESGLGLLIYQTGLIGATVAVALVIIIFRKLQSDTSKSAWIVYWANALLQENLINLNYIILLTAVIFTCESITYKSAKGLVTQKDSNR